jgi:hypothetical protein
MSATSVTISDSTIDWLAHMPEHLADAEATPFLDHAGVEISQSSGQGGPLAPDPIMSSAGHLLPIEL